MAVDPAIRDWARRDRDVAGRLRRVDNRQHEYLRSLIGEFCAKEVEVEARCLIIMSLRIGNHLIPAERGDRTRSEAMEEALAQQLA